MFNFLILAAALTSTTMFGNCNNYMTDYNQYTRGNGYSQMLSNDNYNNMMSNDNYNNMMMSRSR